MIDENMVYVYFFIALICLALIGGLWLGITKPPHRTMTQAELTACMEVRPSDQCK